MATPLFLYDVEQDLLGLLLSVPEVWPDVQFISRDEFSEVRQHLFDVIKQQLDTNQSVAPSILTEKLKSYGQTTTGDVDTFVYLDGLSRRGKLIDKKHALELAKELKKATVKRQLRAACLKAAKDVEKANTFEEMTNVVTTAVTSVNTEYYRGGETSDLFGTMEANIEARGNQEKEELGYVGVLPSIDSTLGPLLHKSGMSLICARSGNGKSSFGFFYSVLTAERHGLPILWLDKGEMTEEQLQFRAACCFSQGKIPLWAVRSNGWRRNKEWVDIMRGEVFPRVRKLRGKFHFKSVAGLSRKEMVAFVKRYYFNKIGRDNFLIVVDDYLKGVEAMGKDSKEYQEIGYYTSAMKSLVTDEINAGFMTFAQTNRFGVSKGKKVEDIVDNDSVISLSDRIKDNCTSVLLMRYKVMQELAAEKNAFGNVLIKVSKIRDGLGKDYDKFVRPIKLAKGYADDYFNLDYSGFHYRDMGLFSEVCKRLGHTAIDLSVREGNEQMP